MSETLLMKSILGALRLRYKKRAFFWRNNSGAAKTERGGFVRFGCPGSPDILGILSPGGRLVALEVKTPKGKVSDLQESWLTEAKALGAVAGVARSIEEAFDLMEKAFSVGVSVNPVQEVARKEETPHFEARKCCYLVSLCGEGRCECGST